MRAKEVAEALKYRIKDEVNNYTDPCFDFNGLVRLCLRGDTIMAYANTSVLVPAFEVKQAFTTWFIHSKEYLPFLDEVYKELALLPDKKLMRRKLNVLSVGDTFYLNSKSDLLRVEQTGNMSYVCMNLKTQKTERISDYAEIYYWINN